jgi:hypothetical protein
MGKVVGALVGLVAVVAYAVAAAEFLRGETGVELLGAVKSQLPDSILVWIARAPFASGEGAPMWRPVIMGVTIGAGAAGALFLMVGARLSAVLLWLAFLLFLGVLAGQDLVLGGGFSFADAPRLIAIAGVLGASFLFAVIANAATAGPREEPGPRELDRADHIRERLRAEPVRPVRELPRAAPLPEREPPRDSDDARPSERSTRYGPPPEHGAAATALQDDDGRDAEPAEVDERVPEKTET